MQNFTTYVFNFLLFALFVDKISLSVDIISLNLIFILLLQHNSKYTTLNYNNNFIDFSFFWIARDSGVYAR